MAPCENYSLSFMKGTETTLIIRTLPRKNMNLPYSIRMYWTNFWQLYIHVQKNIFEKTLIKAGSSHLYASFGTFWVQIGQLVEAQWDFKLTEEFEIDVIFLLGSRTFFNETRCCKEFSTFFTLQDSPDYFSFSFGILFSLLPTAFRMNKIPLPSILLQNYLPTTSRYVKKLSWTVHWTS